MNDLSKKRGFIVFSQEFLIDNPDEKLFKEIYSNFFPIGSVNDYQYGFDHKIKMYGYSPHFRELEEGEEIPQYRIFIKADESGMSFERIKEK